MRLTGEGLSLAGVGEPLTPARFFALLARGEPFAVKTDYRALPPPIEELDLVHVQPARDASPRAALLLCAIDDEGFEFTWASPRSRSVPAAVVTAIERTGRVVRLDTWRWRLLGGMLAASPAVARGFSVATALSARLWRAVPPAATPIFVPPAEQLIAEVRAKWGAPAEVRLLAATADPVLEPWEADVFARLVRAGARVLVVGCGAGREALALAERGFEVTGIDFVPALIDEARRRAALAGSAATFEATTVEELASRAAQTFDTVLSTTPVYEQTPGRARRVGFLRTLTRLTAPGGLIVLCAGWHPERGPRRALVDATRWVLGRLGMRAAEPGDRFTYHHSIVSDHRTRAFFHTFQRPEEIAGELRRAGLTAELHPEGAWLVRVSPR